MLQPLHILHTNDFHNHLTPAQAERIRQAKAEHENVLLLDAGDAVKAGNLGVTPGGEPILATMSALGYDAMTLGNREFHIVDLFLRAKISRAEFPILCANIRWREDNGEMLPVIPNVTKTMPDGRRVGIFGLTVRMVTERMAARAVSAFVFDDIITSARQQIEMLRPDVDTLIALTHIGLRDDEKLAAACPDLDLIIGGHSHVQLDAPKIINGVPIAQAKCFGHFLGRVTLDGKSVSGRLISLKE